jgi:CheY-like chemotaxis protein
LILLLAEDNLPDALLVREAIKAESLPLEVYVVADGARAIEFMAKAESDTQAPSPDILLLDLNLPKIDGLEVLRRIRAGERYKNIPVLVLTSSEAPSDRAETSKLGAGYFRKPPDLDQFLKLGLVLKQFLERNGLL